MKPNCISFRGFSYQYITKGFPAIRALTDVSINDILLGEIICIVGPNGSGKSTFLDAISGRLKINKSEGEILLNNDRISSKELKLAYIPQKPLLGIIPDLSIIENLIFRKIVLHKNDLSPFKPIVFKNSKKTWSPLDQLIEFISFKLGKAVTAEEEKEVHKFLEDLGYQFLIEKLQMHPGALSGGEQQILTLLSAIYAEPQLIILDEPTSRLDEKNRLIIWSLIVRAAKRGSTIICATHDHDMVERVADRVVTFTDGKVENHEIKNSPGEPRFEGAIRLFEDINQLPNELDCVAKDWWRPGDENLFGNDYFNGDNSRFGYLRHKRLSRDERTLREVEGIMRITNLANLKNPTIIDAPCGWGRHSIEFAKRGFKVYGIDLSENYLEKATRSAEQLNLNNVFFQKGDMRNLPVGNQKFELAINMWTSFGFFDDNDNRQVLKEFNRVLKPGGCLLIHSDLNPARINLGIFDEPPERDLENGSRLHVNEYYCSKDKRVYGTWNIVGNHKIHKYKIATYDLRDWELLASQTNFFIEKTFGSFDINKEAFSSRSQEFIILLRKPKN